MVTILLRLFVVLINTHVDKFAASNLIVDSMTAKKLVIKASVLHVLMILLVLFTVHQAITLLRSL